MVRAFILLVLAVLLSSCSAAPPPLPEEEADVLANSLPPINRDLSTEPITLEVWLDLDFTRDSSLYDELADAFEEAYPQVEVNIFSFVRESIP
ncbi:MAG: hypothetical protein KDF65_15200, partial [Anaerolineae bacterium]|nr:hypothetical protein [Anaerolineae bacterium]